MSLLRPNLLVSILNELKFCYCSVISVFEIVLQYVSFEIVDEVSANNRLLAAILIQLARAIG